MKLSLVFLLKNQHNVFRLKKLYEHTQVTSSKIYRINPLSCTKFDQILCFFQKTWFYSVFVCVHVYIFVEIAVRTQLAAVRPLKIKTIIFATILFKNVLTSTAGPWSDFWLERSTKFCCLIEMKTSTTPLIYQRVPDFPI